MLLYFLQSHLSFHLLVQVYFYLTGQLVNWRFFLLEVHGWTAWRHRGRSHQLILKLYFQLEVSDLLFVFRVEVELFYDYLQLLYVVVEVCFRIQTFCEDRQEIVDSGSLQLRLYSSDSNRFFVYHLHHLPLFPVLWGSSVLRPAEVALGSVVVLLGQVCFDDDLFEVLLVLPDNLKNLISIFDEFAFVNHVSQSLQNLSFNRHIFFYFLFQRDARHLNRLLDEFQVLVNWTFVVIVHILVVLSKQMLSSSNNSSLRTNQR